MRGRKSDPPGLQDLKGNPGKRKTKAEKQVAEANRLAELLASAPGFEGDPLAPPKFLDDPRLAPARATWVEHAPRLHAQNMLDLGYRNLFSLFCIFMGEFIIANDDILAKGYSVMVRTVSGDRMPRENPSVSRRAEATKNVLELSKHFGFTPLDHYKLLKEMGSVLPGAGTGDLFGEKANKAPAEGSAVGILDSFDSEPPADSRPN